jgi:hypothetical protein
MSAWFSIYLGSTVRGLQTEQEIRNAFLPVYVASGQPVDMAVFASHDTDRNRLTVYFSPAAAALAKMFAAAPCDKPKRDRFLSRSAGNTRAWDIFYPRQANRRRASETARIEPASNQPQMNP